MLTYRLSEVQLDEIERELKSNILVRPWGLKWQVRVARIGGEILGTFNDELSAWVKRDDLVRAAMDVIRHASPRSLWGGDAA